MLNTCWIFIHLIKIMFNFLYYVVIIDIFNNLSSATFHFLKACSGSFLTSMFSTISLLSNFQKLFFNFVGFLSTLFDRKVGLTFRTYWLCLFFLDQKKRNYIYVKYTVAPSIQLNWTIYPV